MQVKFPGQLPDPPQRLKTGRPTSSPLRQERSSCARQGQSLVDALMSVSNWMPVYFLWRPNLADEGDNHVLELAVAGGAEVIITANKRDFRRSNLLFPLVRIEIAGEFLERRKP